MHTRGANKKDQDKRYGLDDRRRSSRSIEDESLFALGLVFAKDLLRLRSTSMEEKTRPRGGARKIYGF